MRRRSDRPYDAAAATFDRHCKLPEGVAQAIRGGVLRALDLMRPRRKRPSCRRAAGQVAGQDGA